MTRTVLVAAILTLAATLSIPAAAPPAKPVPKGVAVLVNGHPIYETAVKRTLGSYPEGNRTEFRRSILIDLMVNDLLIDLELKKAGWKVEKAEIDKYVEEMIAEQKLVGGDFDKLLAELKASETELRERIEADMRWLKYASAQATDAAVKKTWEENKELFDGSRVLAQHILITPKDKKLKSVQAVIKELRDIKTKIQDEANIELGKMAKNNDEPLSEKDRREVVSDTFARYAADKSECKTKKHRGLIGPFPMNGRVDGLLTNAAFKLRPGEMSDVVQTPVGYHLILCFGRKQGKNVEYEQVKDTVKELFFDRLLESTAARLRKKAVIRINPDVK